MEPMSNEFTYHTSNGYAIKFEVDNPGIVTPFKLDIGEETADEIHGKLIIEVTPPRFGYSGYGLDVPPTWL